jgi:hypothetical protein
MKSNSTRQAVKSAANFIALFFTVWALVALGLFLAVGCATVPPRAAYHFKPGPAYLPGARPYVHERYPTHP